MDQTMGYQVPYANRLECTPKRWVHALAQWAGTWKKHLWLGQKLNQYIVFLVPGTLKASWSYLLPSCCHLVIVYKLSLRVVQSLTPIQSFIQRLSSSPTSLITLPIHNIPAYPSKPSLSSGEITIAHWQLAANPPQQPHIAFTNPSSSSLLLPASAINQQLNYSQRLDFSQGKVSICQATVVAH